MRRRRECANGQGYPESRIEYSLLAIFVLCGVTDRGARVPLSLHHDGAFLQRRAGRRQRLVRPPRLQPAGQRVLYRLCHAGGDRPGRPRSDRQNTATNLSPTRGLRSIAPSGIKLRKSELVCAIRLREIVFVEIQARQKDRGRGGRVCGKRRGVPQEQRGGGGAVRLDPERAGGQAHDGADPRKDARA